MVIPTTLILITIRRAMLYNNKNNNKKTYRYRDIEIDIPSYPIRPPSNTAGFRVENPGYKLGKVTWQRLNRPCWSGIHQIHHSWSNGEDFTNKNGGIRWDLLGV